MVRGHDIGPTYANGAVIPNGANGSTQESTMRCAKCNRLTEQYAPQWAFHCECWGGPALAGTAAELVAAVRADKLVGHGSCTSIDECYEDAELSEALAAEGITTVVDAVRWARQAEGLWREQATNCRWGEDTDPELSSLREWEAAVKNC